MLIFFNFNFLIFNFNIHTFIIFNVILIGSIQLFKILTINQLILQGISSNLCIFLLLSLKSSLLYSNFDLLLFYYITFLICSYLQVNSISYFLCYILLSNLEYLQYCTNFFNLVLSIEIILFSIIGLIFTEKIITVSIVKAAIYFFLVNVIIALIFLYNCIIFLNTIIVLQTPINLNYLLIGDIIGYYFLIQFNFYSIIIVFSIVVSIIALVILVKLTIIPFASQIICVYSEVSQILLLILITIYKLFFLIILIKLFLQNFSILINFTNIITGLALYTLIFGIFAYQQLNLKVILTYLTLIQISFILLGLMPQSILCQKYSFMYFGIYIIQLIAVICVLIISKCENINYFSVNISYLKYVNLNHFIYLFIILISIWGLPPILGFFAKFFLILIVFNNLAMSSVFLILGLIISTSIIYFQILQNLFYFFKNFNINKNLVIIRFFPTTNLNIFISCVSQLNGLGIVVFPILLTYYIYVYFF